jgi:hypothetical protein
MKNLFQICIAFAVILLFSNMTGCTPEKDPCAKVICLNNGACIDGTCSCPTGYEGLRCEKRIVDPCANKVCYNGGRCVDGSCNCPTGYSGPECRTVSTCYVENKGTVSVRNLSKTGRQYRVLVDGAVIGTPYYGESATALVRVGQHTLEILYQNGGGISCSTSIIQVSRCETSGWNCGN